MQSTALPNGKQRRAIHRPALACGVSILECQTTETLWKGTTCPYQKGIRPIESVDHGAKYYRQHFLGQEHQSWFGMDEQLGPVAISIKREKLLTPGPNYNNDLSLSQQQQQYQFRLIVRTSELLTLRGSVIEDSIPNPRGIGKQVTTKEVLEYVAPEVQINTLKLGVSTPQCEQQLLKLDEQGLTNKYKVGILYCRAGQASEEDMYNNEDAGPAFHEFLELIGKRVRLKGFDNYKAGLDNKTDSTGTHSLYAIHQDCEIMFHVSTMLPFTPNNRQQLLRKRHIGNDIVTIVFQEPGALPFTPKNIRSQFQHVFIIVKVVNPCSDNTHYRVAVSRSKEVPVFGPPIRPSATYSKGKNFSDFLLAKLVNAENAAHRSEKFATMATRTRQEYLKDLCTNYVTTTVVDSGPKFSIFPSKKKERSKPRFSGDISQRGAFCWQVVLHDSGQSSSIDCFLGISAETFVLIEECSRQIVFVSPCKSVLGWSTNGNSLRVYHHQGECVTLNMRDSSDRDEQLEVIERLRAVTSGCGALELSLRRNPMGQLGFHVQPDGVVTQVEISGQAWTSGLRQGYRLVEICKVAVSTLSHDQMVDLLKTSAQVTVTVIESFSDSSPRRGCFLKTCKFNLFNYEGDYENLNSNSGSSSSGNEKQSPKKIQPAQLQQASTNNHRRRYERNFSPPRSSNSSGYGTGSSSRSFSVPNEHVRYLTDMGTLTSSSSGHSSNDDRWYDILEVNDESGTQPQYQHTKVTHASNSLPLSNTSRPLSIHEGNETKNLNLNKAAAINESRPLPRTANIEYLVTRVPKVQDYVSSDVLMKSLTLSEDLNSNPEPIYTSSNASKNSMTTDDENLYSDSVSDKSPHLRRSSTTNNILNNNNIKNSKSGTSSSTSSSRNNSPRPNEAKLRTTRNTNHLQQRNSVNYTSSTLQEDLMKLINPDYQTFSDDNFHQGGLTKPQKNSPNSHSLGNISNLSLKPAIITNTDDLLLMKKKSRSREAINLGSNNNVSGNLKISKNEENSSTEVIFTTARPATVISSNSSACSPAPSDKNVLYIKEENLSKNASPRKTSSGIVQKRKNDQQLPLLPDSNDLDWSSLVDTATRAIFQEEFLKSSNQSLFEQLNGAFSNNVSVPLTTSQTNSTDESSTPLSSNSFSTTTNSLQQSSSLPEITNQINQLEERVVLETKRRKSLENAVRRLTDENRRLQDESQAAVQQLRRFTEWFFQTIDRQS